MIKYKISTNDRGSSHGQVRVKGDQLSALVAGSIPARRRELLSPSVASAYNSHDLIGAMRTARNYAKIDKSRT